MTISDTTIDAALLITLDAFTSGLINASSITTLTGSDADKATVRASSGITGLPGSGGGGGGGSSDYTVDKTTIEASELNTLD